MNKELEIWQFAAEKLKHNKSVMLLVVAQSSGSSPGRQGFKMIVAEDEMRGSIGGGVMEMNLTQNAKCRLQDKDTTYEMIEQVHRKNSVNSSGMICSGKQTILLYKLESQNLSTINQIIHSLQHNRAAKLRITNDELRMAESLADEADFKFEKENGKFFYEEKLGFKNKLFIVGGGHCALALSELMSRMDFHISLFDDRADLNTLAKNDFVHEKKIIESYENIGEFISSGANAYIVVMTLGFVFDEIVIRKLFDKNFKYFGVLGSRAKMKTLLKNLEKEGFDTKKLRQIRTPIGLAINSQTPEEIAVSIAAEIIAVKNSK